MQPTLYTKGGSNDKTSGNTALVGGGAAVLGALILGAAVLGGGVGGGVSALLAPLRAVSSLFNCLGIGSRVVRGSLHLLLHLPKHTGAPSRPAINR